MVGTRLDLRDADALRAAARLPGRSLSAEPRAAARAHLAAMVERTPGSDDAPGGNGGASSPTVQESSVGRAAY